MFGWTRLTPLYIENISKSKVYLLYRQPTNLANRPHPKDPDKNCSQYVNVEPFDCASDEDDAEHNHIYLGGDCDDSAALQMSDLTMCPLSFLVSSIQRSSDLF